MSATRWVYDAVLDQRSDAVLAEFVAEGFRVVASVGSEAPEVAGVSAGNLWTDLRIVFLARYKVGSSHRSQAVTKSERCDG